MATIPVDPLPTKPASGTLADAAEIKSKFDTLYAYPGTAESDLFLPGSGIVDSYKDITGLVDFGWANQTGGTILSSGDFYPLKLDTIGSVAGVGLTGTGTDAVDNAKGFFNFVHADYDISRKTMKLRLRATCLVNATAPGLTMKVGLYPVSLSGGLGGHCNVTLGAVISGLQVTFTTPGASSVNSGVSSEVAVSSVPDGVYIIGLNLSGTAPAGSTVSFSSRLQIRAT